ncbi:MAG: pilin [bacterium]
MNYKKLSVIILSMILFISSANSVLAECDPKTNLDTITHKICYVALEPGAFQGVGEPSNDNLSKYLGQVFNYGIAVAVVLALIMIIWGGIIKMTTDSWSKKDEANAKITNAIYGLGLALISWLLLYTINPNLVKFNSSNNTLLNTPTTQTPANTNNTNGVSGIKTQPLLQSN